MRPIALGDTALRAALRAVTEALADVAPAVLGPHQVGVDMPGGVSVMAHGVRLVLEARRGFVAVKIDLRGRVYPISS